MDVKELYNIVRFTISCKEPLKALEQAVLYKYLLSKEDKKDLKEYQEVLNTNPSFTETTYVTFSEFKVTEEGVLEARIIDRTEPKTFIISEENVVSLVEASMIFSQSVSSILEKSKKLMSIPTEEYSKKLDKFIKELSPDKTRKHLFSFLKYSTWDKEACKDILKFFDNSQGAELFPEVLRKYKIVDKRCFIPYMNGDIPMCLVVSLNPYDVLWCSTGSDFSSCYSLKSEHSGFEKNLYSFRHGDKWKCYMLYTTEYSTSKFKLFSDTKSPCPYMKQRAWGWLNSEGGICVDKEYGGISEDTVGLFDVCKALSPIFTRNDTKLDEVLTKTYLIDLIRSYPDSLKFYNGDTELPCTLSGVDTFKMCDEIYFEYDRGRKSFLRSTLRGHYSRLMSSKKILSDITDFDTTINNYGELCECTPIGQVYPKYLEEFFKDAKAGEVIVPILYLGDYDTMVVFGTDRYSTDNNIIDFLRINTSTSFHLDENDTLLSNAISKKVLTVTKLDYSGCSVRSEADTITLKIKKVFGKQVSFKTVIGKRGED